jgi:hypothetical protein
MCYTARVTEPAKVPEPAQVAQVDAVPAPAVYNADGVDLSLVRAMLGKTPSERLQAVQDVIDLLASAKRAGPR